MQKTRKPFFERLKENFKKLKTLVLMQLKDKIDFSFLSTTKKTIFKVVLSVLKFVVITAIILSAFKILDAINLISSDTTGIPQNFLATLVTIMLLLSIISATLGLTKALYFNKDNPLLLTLPTNKVFVFSSKLIVFCIYEIKRNVTFLLPVLAAYSIINTIPIFVFLWLPIALVLATILIVSISALLSIPTMLISILIKKFKWLEVGLLAIFVSMIVVCLVLFINCIPSSINLITQWGIITRGIQAFITSFNNVFLPLTQITTFFVGVNDGFVIVLFSVSQLLSILAVVGCSVGALALAFACSSPIYYKMASSPFEYKKVIITKRMKNKQHNSFLSVVLKEVKTTMRTPEKLWTIVLVTIGMPIGIFLLNKVYASMDIKLTGENMALAFNVLIMLLVALASNTMFAHIYSEEGTSAYLGKTNPQKQVSMLFGKLVANIVCVSVAIFASIIVMSQFIKYSFLQTATLFLLIECVFFAHALWSAEMDLMNPQTAQYQSTGGHVGNPNETKSTITSFVLSALTAFLVFFFVSENASVAFVKVLIFAMMFLALRVWLFVNKIKVYYGEVQQ